MYNFRPKVPLCELSPPHRVTSLARFCKREEHCGEAGTKNGYQTKIVKHALTTPRAKGFKLNHTKTGKFKAKI